MRTAQIALTVLLLAISHNGQAKIGDCPPIAFDGIEYSSHDNFVEATKQSTANTLWRTVLFTERYVGEFDPSLEEDVQWNIACVRKVTTDEVLATDGRGRFFHVDRLTGRLMRVEEQVKK